MCCREPEPEGSRRNLRATARSESLAVELTVSVERRSDIINISDCCTPHKNILLNHGG